MNTDKPTELAGELVDTIDNLLAATQLPMPAQFHLDQLKAHLATMRAELHAAYVEATGDDPWEGHP